MSDFTKMSSKGQVVIPRPIRDALALTVGTALEVAHVGDMIVLRRATGTDLAARLTRLAERGQSLADRAGIHTERDVVRAVRNLRRERARRRG
jgi:AbrB family looped-hinge helix DNA binding protein